jgi:enterochelin esterase-like enzyme
MSGFNGFLNPRYIDDPTAGLMIEIPGSSWFYFKKELANDARIFYQFINDTLPYNDPLNPRLGYRFNRINSELRMPGFESNPNTIENQSIEKGTIMTVDINSGTYPDRTVQVYMPPGYKYTDETYPLLLLHDGSAYIEMGRVPQILDNLIASGKIPPLIAVFDDPVIRGQEYRGDSSYINYIDNDLIPFVDRYYRTMQGSEHRTVIGGSRGGLSALILSHTLNKFSKCGVFSPAIYPRTMDDFIEFLSNAPHQPKQVFILGAFYDGIWYQDAVNLKRYFQKQPIDFQYLEISQGHNLQAWAMELDTMLTKLFLTESQ